MGNLNQILFAILSAMTLLYGIGHAQVRKPGRIKIAVSRPKAHTFVGAYGLSATSRCDASQTKTVSVHITPEIERTPAVGVNSVFFPTDYPEKDDSYVGLLRSQQETLNDIAAEFLKYAKYHLEAKLSIAAYSDNRGPQDFNLLLSERRGMTVMNYLVGRCVSVDQIELSAYGLRSPLDKDKVKELEFNNPNKPLESHVKDWRASWFAYNRRADIVLLPKNREPQRYYPNSAPDAEILWQRSKPSRKAVDQDEHDCSHSVQTIQRYWNHRKLEEDKRSLILSTIPHGIIASRFQQSVTFGLNLHDVHSTLLNPSAIKETTRAAIKSSRGRLWDEPR